VLLNRTPSTVETLNDLDGDIVNFFRVLRDSPEELVELLSMTPYSREEFALSLRKEDGISDLERARRFFVRVKQSRNASAQSTGTGSWSFNVLPNNGTYSIKIGAWINGKAGLIDVANRLMRVQIENEDAIKVISKYDSPHTLFYCDPPYPASSRVDTGSYGDYEVSDEYHERLASALHGIVGKAAVSGYECDIMNDLYGDWNATRAPALPIASSNTPTADVQALRTEVLWTNYDVVTAGPLWTWSENLRNHTE